MNEAKTFTVTVDGESVEIPRKDVTPRIILTAASLDPAVRYLIEKHGNQTTSYQNKLDDEITVHQNQVFLTACLGPITVS